MLKVLNTGASWMSKTLEYPHCDLLRLVRPHPRPSFVADSRYITASNIAESLGSYTVFCPQELLLSPDTTSTIASLLYHDLTIASVNPARYLVRHDGSPAQMEQSHSFTKRNFCPVVSLEWSAGRYSEKEPFWARVIEKRLMTHGQCPKRVLHISLDISSAGMSFKPGDAIGMCPANEPHIVDELLSTLSIDGNQCVVLLFRFCLPRLHCS